MPNVLLITSYGCTPCLRVKRILNELQAEMPNLKLEEVEYSSPTGVRLSIANGITYPPAVFLDGRLIAKGKVDANALIQTVRENRANVRGGS